MQQLNRDIDSLTQELAQARNTGNCTDFLIRWHSASNKSCPLFLYRHISGAALRAQQATAVYGSSKPLIFHRTHFVCSEKGRANQNAESCGIQLCALTEFEYTIAVRAAATTNAATNQLRSSHRPFHTIVSSKLLFGFTCSSPADHDAEKKQKCVRTAARPSFHRSRSRHLRFVNTSSQVLVHACSHVTPTHMPEVAHKLVLKVLMKGSQQQQRLRSSAHFWIRAQPSVRPSAHIDTSTDLSNHSSSHNLQQNHSTNRCARTN
jgi:hypothetical protein